MHKRIKLNYNQMALPFGEVRERALSYDTRIRFFWTLTAVSLLSLMVYVYAINALSRHVAERQELERSVAQLSAELATLEFAYIDKRNAITLEVAHELGFSEVKAPLYVSRDASDPLSFNTRSQ